MLIKYIVHFDRIEPTARLIRKNVNFTINKKKNSNLFTFKE